MPKSFVFVGSAYVCVPCSLCGKFTSMRVQYSNLCPCLLQNPLHDVCILKFFSQEHCILEPSKKIVVLYFFPDINAELVSDYIWANQFSSMDRITKFTHLVQFVNGYHRFTSSSWSYKFLNPTNIVGPNL